MYIYIYIYIIYIYICILYVYIYMYNFKTAVFQLPYINLFPQCKNHANQADMPTLTKKSLIINFSFLAVEYA